MASHITINEETKSWDLKRNMKHIAIAAAIARFTQSLMYNQVMYLTKKYRKHFHIVMMSQRISAVIYLLSAVLQYNHNYYYIFWIIAIFMERSFVMMFIHYYVDSSREELVFAPWHFGHLIHREVCIHI
jgi:uncharacterized protein YacL